ncbi:MAG: VOC family protein [Microbacteriaceae bacterium]
MRYALDHVGLSVADLEAQAEWYARALGLKRTGRFEVPPLGLRGEFVLSDEGWAIELLEREGSDGGLRAPDPMTALLTRGYGHVCLRVADVDAMFDALIAAGALERLSPRESPEPGVRFAFVADPEGNLIELLDRPGPIGTKVGA